MARDRANINTAIWTSEEFRELPPAEQHLYFLLTTHPKLSYVGVADWRLGRIATMAGGWTTDEVSAAGHGLQRKRFVLIDEETEEILVRSFMRHDGLLKQPKLSVSMVNAYGDISSNRIRQVVTFELQRLHSDYPEWAAFRQEKVTALLKGKGRDMEAFTRGVTPASTLPFRVNDGQADPLPTSTATTTSSKEDTSSSEISNEIVRPDVQELLDLLDSCLEANGSKKPTRTRKNRDAARLLIDLDRYTVEEVSWMIRWATRDEFWRGNILSMSKLREKFDQLRVKAGVGGPKPTAGFSGEIDVDAILGRDVWSPGTPPSGLDINGEIEWKKQQRATRRAERLAEAKAKVGVAS